MLKEQNIKQNNGKLYFNVLGYLLIHPDTFKYNKLQGRNKFFCVFCKRCEYRSGTMEVNFEENAITCSLCQN